MIIFLIILIILFIFSIICNVILFSYSKKIVKDFLDVSNNIKDLLYLLKNYEEHLNKINEMEIYYGDDTIRDLILHSKQIIEIIKSYKDLYYFIGEENSVLENDEEKK